MWVACLLDWLFWTTCNAFLCHSRLWLTHLAGIILGMGSANETLYWNGISHWLSPYPEYPCSGLWKWDDIFKWFSWKKIDMFWSKFSLDLVPKGQIDNKSLLVQVMTWCCQVTSHPLNQCWSAQQHLCGVTRPQWVNHSNRPLLL